MDDGDDGDDDDDDHEDTHDADGDDGGGDDDDGHDGQAGEDTLSRRSEKLHRPLKLESLFSWDLERKVVHHSSYVVLRNITASEFHRPDKTYSDIFTHNQAVSFALRFRSATKEDLLPCLDFQIL